MNRTLDRTTGTTTPGLSFRANASWALVGSLVHSVANWAILLVLARLSNPETVGTFALALAISGPVFVFLNFQLRAIQSTDALQEYSSSIFIKVRAVTSTFAILGVSSYTVITDLDKTTKSVVILYSIGQSFVSLSDVLFGHFQKIGRQDWIARSQSIKGVLSLVLLAGTFGATRSLPLATAALALANLVPLLLFDLPAARTRSPLEHHPRAPSLPLSDQLRSLSKSALPLGLTMLILSLNINIPRYFLESHVGRHDLGIFAALSQLIAAGSLVVASIGQAMSPRLARSYKTGNLIAFKRDLTRFVGLAAAVSAGGILLSLFGGREILALIYGKEYASASPVLILLSVGGSLAFIAGVAGSALTACGFHRIQPLLFSTTLVATAIASYALIPSHGATGASASIIASGFVQLVISWSALLYNLRVYSNAR